MSQLAWTILLVAMTAIWGWSFVVVKSAIATAGVLGFLTLRFVVASACLSPLSARRLTRRTVLAGLGIGAFMATGFVFQTLGLRYTSPTNSGLITGLGLILAPVAARVFFGVRPPRITVACLGACLAGLVLLTAPSPSEFRLGDLFTGLCAVAFGMHIALLSHYAPRHDAGALTLVQMVVAAGVFAACWFAMGTPAWPPASVWPALLLTGVLASAAAFYVQTRVQQRLSAARTSVILATEPLFASFFGYLLTGDRLAPLQIVGGAIIAVSLIVGELAAARGPSKPAAAPQR
jgi:drug/metabolite transporter (DMT)-like permease